MIAILIIEDGFKTVTAKARMMTPMMKKKARWK